MIFQRKNNGLKKTECHRINHSTGMPEILIHKKTVCSTERITEASITKTKIIEQTIKVLILDMEESNKDTIKTQYKTIPLT